ncbi:MAG: FecCD family ABC transporter permease, partial [Plesiomonas shigelloides]
MLRLKLSLLGSSGLLLLGFMLLLSIATGPVRLPLSESLHALLSLPSHVNDLSTQQLIIQTIRLPRTLLCISVGAILALAGAVLQGLFRNPLADPGIIGVSGGAALGAGLSIVLLPAGVSLAGLSIAGFSLGWLSLGYTALCAFLCGMLTTLLVYRIGRTPFGTSVNMMLLAGVAIGAIAFSGLGLLSYLADDQQLRDLSLWQMGSLAGARWDTLLLSSLTLLVLLAGFYRQAPAL